jgi:putative methyltransferase (TIGR04325 family)
VNTYARQVAAAGIHMAGRVPLLRIPLEKAHRHFFNKRQGELRLFSGVFPNFQSAIAAVPAGRLIGFDNPPSARRLIKDLFHVYPMDYPVMFWLMRLFPRTRLLFDWGGNVGISYFAFRRHLDYPPDLTWLVNDVPAVVDEGLATAATRDSPGLCFSTTLDRLKDADVLLAAGTLQFIETPFKDFLQAGARPAHILLNKVPVYALPSAVTLLNMGTAMVPNHLFNESQFAGFFYSLGYQLIDEWDTGLSCHIPFHEEHSIHAYKGYYFSIAS